MPTNNNWRLIERLYYNSTSSAFLAGANELYRSAAVHNPTVTQAEVSAFLDAQEIGTKFRPTRRHAERRRTHSVGVHTSISSDLIDLRKWSGYNKGRKWLLLCICCFSKQVRYRALLSKSAIHVLEGLKDALDSYSGKVYTVLTDYGKEYSVDEYLNGAGIQHIQLSGIQHNPIGERAVRTCMTRLTKYFNYANTHDWVSFLPTLENIINTSRSRAHGLTPNQVTLANERTVYHRLYGKVAPVVAKKRFADGTKVRLRVEKKSVFSKGYTQSYSSNWFEIVERFRNRPERYRIRDPTNGSTRVALASDLTPFGEGSGERRRRRPT